MKKLIAVAVILALLLTIAIAVPVVAKGKGDDLIIRTATDVEGLDITGNVYVPEGEDWITIMNCTIGGNVEVSGGTVVIDTCEINGNIELDDTAYNVKIIGNTVGGHIKVDGAGEVDIWDNTLLKGNIKLKNCYDPSNDGPEEVLNNTVYGKIEIKKCDPGYDAAGNTFPDGGKLKVK